MMIRIDTGGRLHTYFPDKSFATVSRGTSLTTKIPSSDYRPDIDGLRAVAVLLVVFYHFDPDLVTGGFIGVDMFFVISGYLITGIIVKGIQAGNFSLVDFYVRRCRRILPTLFTMLVVIFGLGWVVLLPDEFRDLGKETLAGVLFSENMLLAKEAGYFDVEAVRKPLLHLWSLAIEEQFYLFWPLTLLLAHRFRIKLPTVSFALMRLSFIFGAYYALTHSVAAFYLLPSRFWEILSGACLFHMESRLPNTIRGRTYQNAKAFVALIIILGVSLLFRTFIIFEDAIISLSWLSLIWASFSCLAAILLISAGQNAWINRRILSSPPLVFIGRISYPLYLWHWPLLSIAYIMGDEKPVLVARLSIVLLSFLLAWLTFRFIEQPVRNPSSPFFRARFVGISATAAAVVISTLGYCAFSQTGFLGTSLGANTLQFDDIDQASIQPLLDREWWKKNQLKDTLCEKSFWKPDHADPPICRLTDLSPRVMLLGDSHVNHLIPGLISVNDATFSHIVEVSNYDKEFVENAISDKNIRYVIISLYNKHFINLEEVTSRFLYKNLLQNIELLEKAGKQIIFFIDIPTLDVNPLRCLNVRRFSLTSRDRMLCARSLTEVLAEQVTMRRMITDLAKQNPKMKVFDPTPAMCDKNYCYAIRDKKMLYRDSDHLSVDGSIFVARAFMASMKK